MNTGKTVRLIALLALLCAVFATVPRAASAHEGGPHLRIAHLAPAAGAIDVYVNDQAVQTNVKYKDVTRYKGVDGKEFKITAVAAGGKPTELLNKEPLMLKFNDIVHGNYTIAAVGSPKDGTFELIALPEDAVQPPTVATGAAKVGTLEISGGYARPTVSSEEHHHDDAQPTAAATPEMKMNMMGSVSAAYMKITNSGDQADTLVSVTADVGDAQVHETVVKDNVASMQEVKAGLEIPAKGSVELRPGSYHIMLINLKRDLKAGDAVKLTLKFKSGTEIAVDVPVKAPDAK